MLWATARLDIEPGTALRMLWDRSVAVVAEMDWQALGHAEYAARTLIHPEETVEDKKKREFLLRQVEIHSETAMRAVDAKRGEKHAAAESALLRLWGDSPPRVFGEGCKLLLVDDFSGVVGTWLEEQGCEVTAWNRFANGESPGEAWPAGQGYTACVMRLSPFKASFHMALHAASSVMEPSSPIWVYGARDEGINAPLTPF